MLNFSAPFQINDKKAPMPSINCQTIHDVLWNKVTTNSFNLDDTVHVWRVQISPNLNLAAHYLSILHPAEKLRADAYADEKDRNRFILSRGFLRVLLSAYPGQKPAEIELSIGKNKKPFVITSANSNICYNMAHSEDWILVVIANTPIGADVEYINEGFSYEDIFPDCFSNDEIAFLQTEITPRSSFYQLWTRKEALTKATSKGIDDGFAAVPCMDGSHYIEATLIDSPQDWTVTSFELAKNYVAAVAYNPFVKNILFFDGNEFLQR
jgi:4'-phosphopantetheinyl transferase